MFDVYKYFITNFDNSLAVSSDESKNNEEFRKLLKEGAEKKDCNGLNFGAFIIMPIQRIPRYILLLTDLLKNTPKNHAEFTTLENSLLLAKKLSEDINKAKLEFENQAKLREIQKILSDIPKELMLDSKECIKEGLVVEQRKGHSSRYIQIFLFSDIMIVCGFHDRKTMKSVKIKIENVIEVIGMNIVDLPVDEATGQGTLLLKWDEIGTLKEIQICMSVEDSKLWLTAIQAAQSKWLK